METFKVLIFFAMIFSFGVALNDVEIRNLKIYFNGVEFFINGMCYNPTPLGRQDMLPDQTGGTGFCSPKLTAFNEWKSACFDSDYFDGSPQSPGRTPPGPGGATGQWFSALWQRDLPLIKSLGFNTVRLYNANPSTLQATINDPITYPLPLGKYHVPFLDYADSLGLKVIFPLYGDNTALVTKTIDEMKQYIRNQIDEVGYHPAIIMYTLGNELGLYQAPVTLMNTVNTLLAYARGYSTYRWNRKVLVTTAEIDLPLSYDPLFSKLDVDVFTTNAGYRGKTFTTLWSGDSFTSGLFNLSCFWNKPVFIGEIGAHDFDGWKNDPTWFNAVWTDLYNHIQQGCVGGAFFEWSDEIGKDAGQRMMGVVSVSTPIGGQVANNWNPDQIQFKTGQVAQTILAINASAPAVTAMTNPWTFINRPQTVIANPGTDICIPKGGNSNRQRQVDTNIVLPTPPPIPTAYANYTFDLLEGNFFRDFSGNNRQATIGGAVVTSPGQRNNAAAITRYPNGVDTGDQFINIGTTFIANQLSVSAWIWIQDTTLNNNMKLLSCKNVWNDPTGWEIEYNPGANRLAVIGSGDDLAIADNVDLLSQTWYSITVRVNYNRAFISVNGVDVTTDSYLSPIVNTTRVLLIGSSSTSPNIGGTWTGRIDDLIIYDKYLPQSSLNTISNVPISTTGIAFTTSIQSTTAPSQLTTALQSTTALQATTSLVATTAVDSSQVTTSQQVTTNQQVTTEQVLTTAEKGKLSSASMNSFSVFMFVCVVVLLLSL